MDFGKSVYSLVSDFFLLVVLWLHGSFWLNEGVAAPASMTIICFSGPTFPRSPFPPIFSFSTHVEFPWSSFQFATSFVASTLWKKGHAYTHTHTHVSFCCSTLDPFSFSRREQGGEWNLTFYLIIPPFFQFMPKFQIPMHTSPVFLLFFFLFLFLSPK